MNFKTKIKEVITKLKSNKDFKNLNFNELEENDLYILEEIYYFNEIPKNNITLEDKKLINNRYINFIKLLKREDFKDINLEKDFQVLFNDTFIKLIGAFNNELNIRLLQNIKSKIDEQQIKKNIVLDEEKKLMIYKSGIKHFFYKYTNLVLENNKTINQESGNQSKKIKHLQSYNNMVKLENIIKEMNQSGGNMNLVNLFKILNNVFNKDENEEISEVEKEKIQILSRNINFYDEKSKKYIKKYLNYDDGEESEKELNIFIEYLKELREIPEDSLNKVQEEFNKYKGKEVNNKELSNAIFQLNLEQKNNFDNLLNSFTSEVLKKLSGIKNDMKNELKSLLKIYIENNLNNMCDEKGNLRIDLNVIEILKDINSRTFKITPEKEYKETGKILKNVFEFSDDIHPKVSFKGGGRGELDIIYHNDFNFIGCSTTLKETINFEENQLLNHPYKLYKISEKLDYDENVDIKKMLNLLKQDSRTESFDKEYNNYNGKLGTKENLRTDLFEIKTSIYDDNIVKIRKDEKIFKKILEEISFEFHLHKEKFLVKDLKDYEKLFMKNLFMSALINNDYNNISGENINKVEELYGFMNKVDKSFLNIPFDIEKKYETLNVSKTNKDFGELMIYSLLDKNLEDLKDNEILKIYKNDGIKDEKIKKRLFNSFLFKNKNYLNITVRNLSQYITFGNNKEDLGLISQNIEKIYKEKYKDRQLSTPDFNSFKEREESLKKDKELELKDKELEKEREEKLKEREEKNRLMKLLKQNGIDYPNM